MEKELELYIKANYAKLEGDTLVAVKDAFEAAWQARVPEGYKLVPVELADEIEDKIWDNLSANHTITNQEGDGFIPVEDIDLGGIYKAMIKAVEK